MPAEEALKWEAQLDSLRNECACRTGAFAVAALALSLLFFTLTDELTPSPETIVSLSLVGLIALVAVGIIGRLVAGAGARGRGRPQQKQVVNYAFSGGVSLRFLPIGAHSLSLLR